MKRSLAQLMSRPWQGAALVTLLVTLVMASGALQPLEEALAGHRFRLIERAPTRDIVVVEIDSASLRAAGEWPWTRQRYATVIDNLDAAGARQIGFDVDFSAKSNPQADAAFARAISEAHAVILPTFIQPELRHDPNSRLVENTPMAGLSDAALLASVNVPLETDGTVRRYLRGFGVDETYRPTMAHMLSGGAYGRTDPFLIDYGIQSTGVPRLSFQDIYAGRFHPEVVRGKSILIGATALELGDTFATPRHGILPGVLVHALAFESLRQGRALHLMPLPLTLGLIFLLAAWLRPPGDGDLSRLTRRHTAAIAVVLGGAFVMQALLPLSPTVAPLLLTQLLCGGWAVQVELRRRAEAVHKAREAGLLHLALHESETELPNRRALLSEIAKLRSAPGGANVVLAVGLDRYPEMRAAIGYGLVNHVVRAVAARVLRTCHGSRLGYLSTGVLGLVLRRGDEEAVAMELAALGALSPAHEVQGHLVDVFLRIGVAYDDGETDDEQLLERATAALDEARRIDRRILAYDPEAFPDPSLTLALMSEMQVGLERGDISLSYQPKALAATGVVTGVEALMRWRHPERGPIRPDIFIAAAEETGSIRALTEWSLHQALTDSARFRAAGHDLLVSVNVSARLLGDTGFREQALAAVRGRESELCFEITETALIENPQAAMESVSAFRNAGLKVSIDDYGVGLSSLSYLKMLDAHELKLDRSIATEVSSERDRLILKSTIELAHGLGMSVVAEGVETEVVRTALADLGCDLIQGYLISPPVTADALTAWLAEPRAA